MPALEFRAAIARALAEEMQRDERVIFFGEDVAAAGGVFKATEGLMEQFGTERVFDTPISELAIVGAAYGSAITGLRPVIEIMFGDFMALPMDCLVNQAAKYWFLSNERAGVPLVVRTGVGAGGRFGAIHSQNPGTWFHGIPGLKVVAPSRPSDALGMLKWAIRDENPVIFLEHKRLYSDKEEFEGGTEHIVPADQAIVRRPGGDITLVSIMQGVGDCLAAADALGVEGISAEVIDLRSLRPMDVETVAESLARTNRMLAVEEGPRTGGWALSLAGELAERSLADIDDLAVVATPDSPLPYSPPLEDAFLPRAERIVAEVKARLGMRSAA